MSLRSSSDCQPLLKHAVSACCGAARVKEARHCHAHKNAITKKQSVATATSSLLYQGKALPHSLMSIQTPSERT